MRMVSPTGPVVSNQPMLLASGLILRLDGRISDSPASEADTMRRPGALSSGVICQYQPECVSSNSGSPMIFGTRGSLPSCKV